MTISLTLEQSFAVYSLFNKLSNIDNLPIKTMFKLAKINQKLKENALFFQEKINKLLENYAARDDKGQYIMDNDNVQLREDTAQECQSKLNELKSIQVDIQIESLLNIEELASISISMNEMELLLPFLEE